MLQRVDDFVSGKHFATLKRSCLRLVKKLTGEFMRVNELVLLGELKTPFPKKK